MERPRKNVSDGAVAMRDTACLFAMSNTRALLERSNPVELVQVRMTASLSVRGKNAGLVNLQYLGTFNDTSVWFEGELVPKTSIVSPLCTANSFPSEVHAISLSLTCPEYALKS